MFLAAKLLEVEAMIGGAVKIDVSPIVRTVAVRYLVDHHRLHGSLNYLLSIELRLGEYCFANKALKK